MTFNIIKLYWRWSLSEYKSRLTSHHHPITTFKFEHQVHIILLAFCSSPFYQLGQNQHSLLHVIYAPIIPDYMCIQLTAYFITPHDSLSDIGHHLHYVLQCSTIILWQNPPQKFSLVLNFERCYYTLIQRSHYVCNMGGGGGIPKSCCSIPRLKNHETYQLWQN